MASLPLLGGGSSGSPVPLPMAGAGGTPTGYSLGSTAAAIPGGGGTVVSKKSETLGPAGTSLEGQLLASEYTDTRPHTGWLTDFTSGPVGYCFII